MLLLLLSFLSLCVCCVCVCCVCVCVCAHGSEIARVRQYNADQENAVQSSVTSLKALGQQILAAKYENLTTYTFETPSEVEGRESAIDARFDDLSAKCTAKSRELAVKTVRWWWRWWWILDSFLLINQSSGVFLNVIFQSGLLDNEQRGRETAVRVFELFATQRAIKPSLPAG